MFYVFTHLHLIDCSDSQHHQQADWILDFVLSFCTHGNHSQWCWSVRDGAYKSTLWSYSIVHGELEAVCVKPFPSEHERFLSTYSVQDDIIHSLQNDIVVGCWNLLTWQMEKCILNLGWQWNTGVIGIIVFLWTSLPFRPSISMVPFFCLLRHFIQQVGGYTTIYLHFLIKSFVQNISLFPHVTSMAKEGTWKSLVPTDSKIAACYCCRICVFFLWGGDWICASFLWVILTPVVFRCSLLVSSFCFHFVI